MDCGEDLEFNDDSGKGEEKAKESILLMKKKMLRSHDLILQYNNKLKECDRLKGDLCVAHEEAMKLRQEGKENVTKVITLESKNAEYKKSRQDLESKLAEQEIRIASDKSHLQQLICKLEDIEEKHSQKLMEVELEKSSVEVKVKDLEQELKSLKKSHLADIHKLEKTINPLPPKPRKGAKGFKNSKEVGVNTTEKFDEPRPPKPSMVDKSVMTNEFYHITDNPYPIFCDKCETPVEPSVDKICKIMTNHPPLLTEMLSPPRRREIPPTYVPQRSQDARCDSSHFKVNHNNFGRDEFKSKEMSLIDMDRAVGISRNLVSPIESSTRNVESPNHPRPVDSTPPEIEILRRKLETLERKIKKRKKEKTSDAPPSSCCGHTRTSNCCGPSHANAVPNAFGNGQSDMMTEFWNRLMKFTNQQAARVPSPRKIKKPSKVKLRRLNKAKVKATKKTRNCGSSNWQIESDDCKEENNVDSSRTNYSHILRIKPSEMDSTGQSPENTLHEIDDFAVIESQPENSSDRPLPVKIPDKTRNASKKIVSSLGDGAEMYSTVAESSRGKITGNNAKSITINRKDLSVSASFEKSSEAETTNISLNSESAYFSQNSAFNDSVTRPRDVDLEENSMDCASQVSGTRDESVSNSTQDPVDSDFSNDKFAESAADFSDGGVEHVEEDPPRRSRGRKRKRSGSPQPVKATSRSKLLGKLRALKKNSITGVAKTSLPNVRQTRSRGMVNYSEVEEAEEATVEVERASISAIETDSRGPTKKQRIAHVPKVENNPEDEQVSRSAKLRQICQESASTTIKREQSTGRRSILIEPNPEGETRLEPGKTTAESSAIVPPDAPKVRRRGRPPGKKNSTTKAAVPINTPATRAARVDSSGSSKKSAIDESSLRVTSEPESNLVGKISETTDTEITKPQEIPEARTTEKNQSEDLKHCEEEKKEERASESRKSAEIQQKNSTCPSENVIATSESSGGKILEDRMNSEIPSTKSAASTASEETTPEESGFSTPREKRESAAKIEQPAESGQFDSPASPDANSSPEAYQMTPAKAAISPIVSPDYPNHVSKKPSLSSTSVSQAGESTAIETKPIDSARIEDSILYSKLTESASSSQSPSTDSAPSKISDETLRTSDVANPSSLISRHRLPVMAVKKTKQSPKKRLQRSPVCGNSSFPQKAPLTPSENIASRVKGIQSATIDNPNRVPNLPNVSSNSVKVERDSSLPTPMEEHTRNLVVYESNMQDAIDKLADSDIATPPQLLPDSCGKKMKSTKGPSKDSAETGNIVKALRSRQVPSGSVSETIQCDRPTTESLLQVDTMETKEEEDYSSGILGPRILLGRYTREQRTKSTAQKLRSTAAARLQAAEEKDVQAQLNELVESEEWTSELHQSVIAKIRGVHSLRTIAKSIVDLLIERSIHNETLDRTHTPPAPLMTATQQRIVTLIDGLERDGPMPGISDLVQKGIQYSLFRLNLSPEVPVIDSLVRISTALAKIKKDRERVRILCCDSIYCLGRKAIVVIFTVLSMWPEVFPAHNAYPDELPNCIAHIIKLEQSAKEPAIKSVTLAKMITGYYNYPQVSLRSDVVMGGLIRTLQDTYSSSLEASILLLSKKEGTDWAHDNIINGGIMRIIENRNYASHFEILTLLGFILRTFPVADSMNAVGKNADILYKIIESEESSPDQQEGAASALLSLSRHIRHFDRIAKVLLNWKPSRPLRLQTSEQLSAFFKMRSIPWWTQHHPPKRGNIGATSVKNNSD